MLRTRGVTSGNAAEDGADRWGWLVGHFLPGTDGPRATGDVEVKWAVYEGGEVRREWGVNDRAHTLALLVRGMFRLRFPEREVLLSGSRGCLICGRPRPQPWLSACAGPPCPETAGT